eukprot:3550596-Amphidinium_carterae.1
MNYLKRHGFKKGGVRAENIMSASKFQTQQPDMRHDVQKCLPLLFCVPLSFCSAELFGVLCRTLWGGGGATTFGSEKGVRKEELAFIWPPRELDKFKRVGDA